MSGLVSTSPPYRTQSQYRSERQRHRVWLGYGCIGGRRWSPIELGGKVYFSHAGKPDFAVSKNEAMTFWGKPTVLRAARLRWIAPEIAHGGMRYPNWFSTTDCSWSVARMGQGKSYDDELWAVRLGDADHLAGDSDENGIVKFADFLVLAANFDKEKVTRAQGDNDGVVSFADFLILAANFGKQLGF